MADDSKGFPEVLEGIPRFMWFRKVYVVRSVLQKGPFYGLERSEKTECVGGYCKRHHFQRPARFRTPDGRDLCFDCAVLWATRGELKMQQQDL